MEMTSQGRKIVKLSLHMDGFFMLLFGIVLYKVLGYSWGLFALLLLAPDLFMLGYLINKKVGAIIYNLGHILLWPVLFALVGMVLDSSLLISLGIIWLCHIGMDHAFGYGFKYFDSFKHTHIKAE